MTTQIIDTRDEKWTIGGSWSTYRHRPGAHRLRKYGQEIGATHFIVLAGQQTTVGYFTIEAGSPQKTVQPLALAIAQTLGPNAYAEIEIQLDRHWIIGTGADGALLPFSDVVISAADLDRFRQRIPSELLAAPRAYDMMAADALFSEVEPQRYPLIAISRRRELRQWVAGFAAAAALLLAFQVWHRHHLAVIAERARIAAQEAADRARAAAQVPITIAPEEWIEICMRSTDRVPLFYKGWILAKWTCENRGLTLTWDRAGGTAMAAPPGILSSNGETDVDTEVLRFPQPQRMPRAGLSGKRELLAALQPLGIELHQTNPASTSALTSSSVEFTWPIDPRLGPWARIHGLSITTLEHQTGLALQGGGGRSSADLSSVYRIKARLLGDTAP
ncbi:type 4b pilus protein PilO2 [Gluconacetobacter diazotrophicus]|uniref:Type 4b pilus protein PilO2 n=1 Tax=Gluconacetobacter diazotrophicus TaxID=33996 RepID=A0A7W4FFC0_GLUDI|nr:type 4b pilus protein PilO2 [Gluconacetobacter diazotrophicus]MBB2156622.1 type 4b pilus protein PilO2 [Gluconacetobacter diazotrophicus]